MSEKWKATYPTYTDTTDTRAILIKTKSSTVMMMNYLYRVRSSTAAVYCTFIPFPRSGVVKKELLRCLIHMTLHSRNT